MTHQQSPAPQANMLPPENAGTRPVPPTFRAGVGAVILNDDGHVLAFERSDYPDAWQCPQGGLDGGESWEAAVYREVEEETGIGRGDLELLGCYPEALVYELPPAARTPKTGLGQVQRWFFFRLRNAGTHPLTVPTGEFTRARWMTFRALVDSVIAFKRPVYERLLAHAEPASMAE